MGPLRTLVDADQFQSGLAIGVALAVILAVLLVVPRTEARQERRSAPRPPLAGVLFVVASVVALQGYLGFAEVSAVPGDVVTGLVLLVAVVEVCDRLPLPWACRPIGALPGAAMVAFTDDLPGAHWVPWLVFGTTVAVAACAPDLDRRGARLGLGPALFGIAVLGVYATVPDTESARVLIGVALPIALLGVPIAFARLGAGGVAAASALVLWISAYEGIGRPGSVVGAAASFGLLVLEPIGHRFAPDVRFSVLARASRRKVQAIVIGGQVVVTGFASRVAGFQYHGADAALLVAPIIVVGVLFGAAFSFEERRPGSRGSRRRSRPRRGAPELPR
jgi:hypothetical protein